MAILTPRCTQPLGRSTGLLRPRWWWHFLHVVFHGIAEDILDIKLLCQHQHNRCQRSGKYEAENPEDTPQDQLASDG